MGEFGKVGVEQAAQQGIFILDRSHARQRAIFSEPKPLRRSPCALVRQAGMADLAFAAQGFQAVENLLHMREGGGAVLAGRVVVPVLAEHVGAAVRPVKLVEIDIVGAHRAQ